MLAFCVQSHFKELLLEHAPPPPAIADSAMPNLIKMGFPQRAAESSIAICSCHKEAKVGGGYTCPRCKARVCELPTECRICGLTLISSPHLARSYHHLFPIIPFDEVSDKVLHDPRHQLPKVCFGCQESLVNPGKNTNKHDIWKHSNENLFFWQLFSICIDILKMVKWKLDYCSVGRVLRHLNQVEFF